jgi:hypothetical protein
MTSGTMHVPDVAAARQSLQNARRDLDDAVGLLPGVAGDDTMANPNLIALLLRAVVARRHLETLEMDAPPDMRPAALDRARYTWR